MSTCLAAASRSDLPAASSVCQCGARAVRGCGGTSSCLSRPCREGGREEVVLLTMIPSTSAFIATFARRACREEEGGRGLNGGIRLSDHRRTSAISFSSASLMSGAVKETWYDAYLLTCSSLKTPLCEISCVTYFHKEWRSLAADGEFVSPPDGTERKRK